MLRYRAIFSLRDEEHSSVSHRWFNYRRCLTDIFLTEVSLIGRPLQVTVRPMPWDCCPDYPVCNVGVVLPNCGMDQDATWYGDRPQPRRHCVDGDQAPPRKGAQQPLYHFSAHFALTRSPISAIVELALRMRKACTVYSHTDFTVVSWIRPI